MKRYIKRDCQQVLNNLPCAHTETLVTSLITYPSPSALYTCDRCDYMFTVMCVSSCILCLQLYSALATNLDEIRKSYWEYRARRLREKYADS